MGGSRKKSEPVQVKNPDTNAVQQQYQNSLAGIQQQTASSLDTITKANQDTVATLNKQLEDTTKNNQAYQQQLNTYLVKLQESQQQTAQAIAAKDAVTKKQQELDNSNADASSLINNLNSTANIAARQFSSKTSRKRGVIA
jgi:uncharacterized protein YhaN